MNTSTSPAITLATIKPPVSLLLKPVASINDIVAAWQDYQNLKAKLLNESDYQMIQGKNCIKKSGWRKIQTAFSISDELISEERKEYKDYFVYLTTVKTTAPNGRFVFGIGSCASDERRFAHKEHDVRSTAHTRAKNRGISDLVGGGDVSAEEMITDIEAPEEKAEVNDNGWLSGIFSDESNKPVREINTTDEERITSRQRDLLVNLLYQKIADEDERNRRLEMVDGFSKFDASQAIKELLENN
ncbi:MAG: hypothetical protein Q8O93_05310 [bacterium]|nr:hypothetical protein [bacterium]